MKITFATIGSRGDIQPILALAFKFKTVLESKNESHEIVFVTHKHQQTWIESFGLAFKPISVSIEEKAQNPEIAELIVKGETLKFSKAVMDKEGLVTTFNEFIEGCKGSDVIITSGTALLHTFHTAEKYNSKLLVVALSEMHPTGNSMPMFMGSLYFSFLNRIAHFGFRKVLWATAGADLNTCRQAVGLKPLTEKMYHESVDKLPFYYAYSPSVLPKPLDWPENTVVGGFVFMESTGTLEPKLEEFLSSKKNIVYVGFGSMPAQVTTKFNELVDQLIKESPQEWNFVVYVGKSPVSNESWKSNERVFLLTGAPHDLLFPKCNVIVHHGGAGTTASALKAAVPQVICSFFADQPFWAQRMTEIGVGPARPLKFASLTSTELIKGIKQVLEPKVVQKAKEVGEIVIKENMDSKAVQWIYENCFGTK